MVKVSRSASWARRLGIALVGAFLVAGTVNAAVIPVRFAEGSIHGFFILRTQEGRFLAQGDLLEVLRDGNIQKSSLFKFRDGSVFEETVVYSQRNVYTLLSYRLEQRGPAFDADVAIQLERSTGKYRIEIRVHTSGAAKVIEGTLDLPLDVYNGMLPTVVKDLPKGARETVHYVAFTPEPRIIQLDIVPEGPQTVGVGEGQRTAVHYVVHPILGAWLRVVATVLDRVPEEAHVWILDDKVPSFVGFEGQLCTLGPIWRIDLVSPVRPPGPSAGRS